MYYRLTPKVALRKWKYVDRAIYLKGVEDAQKVSQEDFDLLCLCDASHDLPEDPRLENLEKKGFVQKCEKGDEVNSWSLLHEYDNFYFPKMNLMVTGKCNLNCLHCFNAKDNAPLNSELSYEDVLHILDQARDIGVNAFTLTGGHGQECRELEDGRCLLDGAGAEELTLKAISLCVKNGFRVKAQVQVNRKNVSVMMKTAEVLDKLGVETMRIIRTTEAPRWEKNAPQSSLGIEEYYESMLKFACEYAASGLQMEVDVWQFLRLNPPHRCYELVPIACNKHDFNLRIPMCKGNRGMIAVSSSGEVVPCLQMSGYFLEKGISLGNLFKTPLKELTKDSPYLDLAIAPLLKQILENDKCGNCKYYKACTGGCPALGLLYSKESNFYHEDITKCVFFENGWYEKTVDALKRWRLQNPLDID